MNKLLWMILLALVVNSAMAESTDVAASGDTVTAKHRYTMGDNDSKSDATNICFLEAKRKAIEYAGTYVQSSMQITQTDTSRKAQSDMKTIAAALVSAEMVSSKTGFDDGKVFIDCVVNAKVDQRSIKQEANQINSDTEAKKQIEQQQFMLKKLEDEITKIQTQMESASSQQAISLRQERTAVFKRIDKLQQKKLEIVAVIESKGKDVKNLITEGMNFKEVLSLVGQPRVKLRDQVRHNNQLWNYGTVTTTASKDPIYGYDYVVIDGDGHVSKHPVTTVSPVWVNFEDGIVVSVGSKAVGNYEE